MGDMREQVAALGKWMAEHKVLLILCSLFLFHLVTGIVIMSNHATPPTNHAAANIEHAYDVFTFLKAGNLKGALSVRPRYSPFLHFLVQPFLLLFGQGTHANLGVNALSFALLLVSVFLIGKELHSEKAGLLAAFLISFYPQVYGMSRVFMPDFPLTAMIALSLYFLLKTENFSNRKFSLLFGLSVGFAELLKPIVLVYVAGPVLILLFWDIRKESVRSELGGKVKNLGYAILVSQLVYMPWFLTNPSYIVSNHLDTLTMADPFISRFPSLAHNALLDYPNVTLHYQLLYGFGLLLLVSLPYVLFFSSLQRVKRFFIGAFFLIPYIIFSVMMSNKNPRFILPIILGAAVVSAIGMVSVKNRKVRTALIVLCIVLGLFQFWALSFSDLKYLDEGESMPFTRVYFRTFIEREAYVRPIYEWNVGVFRASSSTLAQEDIANILIADSEGAETTRIALATRENIFSPLRYMLPQGDDASVWLQLPFSADSLRPYPEYYLVLVEPDGSCDRGRCSEGEIYSVSQFELEKESYVMLDSFHVYPSATPCSEPHLRTPSCDEEGAFFIEVYKLIE